MIGSILLKNLMNKLPLARLIYRFYQRYISRINGENNSDMHSNGELHWLKEVLPNCRTVFDVGANIGNWTALALENNLNLEIHCFEPSKTTYEILASQKFVGSVFLNQIGLGATPGEIPLYIFGEDGEMNSIHQREVFNNANTQTESITLDTLDDYCQRLQIERIDLLKIDVEGYELDVLKGAHEMLKQCRIQRIQFEYGGTYLDAHILLKDMFELLTSYGYQLYKVYPSEIRLVERYNQQMENFQYQNWVALKT
jgi:FkbM family methyltransferase